jgi:hypothetical protein
VTTCPECGTAYDEQAFAECPTCELTGAPRELAPAAAEPDEGLSRQLNALRANLFGAARAAAEAPAEPRPALKTTDQQEAPAPDDDAPSSDEITFDRLAELRRSKRMVIGILGFPTAGKTWFLNRLKHNWVYERGNKASPPPAETGAEVGRTDIVTEHTFTRPGGGFHVIDLPGERFEAAAESNFQSDPLVLAVIDACGALAIMLPADEALFSGHAAARYEARKTSAGADIVPLGDAAAEIDRRLEDAKKELARLKRLQKKQPSDELAAQIKAAEARRDDADAARKALKARRLADHGADLAGKHRRLERFIAGLGHMSGLLSLKSGADAPSGPVKPAAVDAHIMSGAFKPFAKPVYVALSKADSVLDREGLAADFFASPADHQAWRQDFDHDPLATVHSLKPTLALQFGRWFRWVKFDFLTAFCDHQGGVLINYDLGSRGVNAVVDWMDWIARYDQLPARERMLLASAVRLRALRDYRPQSTGLHAIGGAASKGPNSGKSFLANAEIRRWLKQGVDVLFAKTRWPVASLCAGVLALAVAAGATVALTGALPTEAPKVKDPEAQNMLGVVTSADPKVASLICSQNQSVEARAVRAWAIQLRHDCPGAVGMVAPWPLVVRFGAWLGVPLTALLLAMFIAGPAAALVGYLGLRRAYGNLYSSEHAADRFAEGSADAGG